MKTWSLRRQDLLTGQEWAKLRASLNARAELAEMRGAWTAIQDRAICFVAVWTGLRRSELAALNRADLFLANERPYIVVRHGKGDKHREVIVSPDCRAFIKRFLKAKAERGAAAAEDAPLFVTQRGQRYTADGLYRVWRSACRFAGIPARKIHAARHYFATALYTATRDMRLVQKQLGHSRITTTQVYADLEDSEMLAGMSLLDKRLRMSATRQTEERQVPRENAAQ